MSHVHAAVTRWVDEFRKGRDEHAAARLWDTYFERLMVLALAHLRTHRTPHPAREDCEDVAISAFHSFCQATAAGRFPRLQDREDLWVILVFITRQKAANLLRREGRVKRGGRYQRVDAAVDDVAEGEPGPEEAAIAADLYRELFARLEDDRFRATAQLRMEGWTVPEVAEQLGVAVTTVERRLRFVREQAEALWGLSSAGLGAG